MADRDRQNLLDAWRDIRIDLGVAVVARGQLFDDLLPADAHAAYLASIERDPKLGA